MKTITIEDPAEVDALLAAEYPQALAVGANFNSRGWSVFALLRGSQIDPNGCGATPEEAIADLRVKLAEADPINLLRKEAEAAGFALTPLPLS